MKKNAIILAAIVLCVMLIPSNVSKVYGHSESSSNIDSKDENIKNIEDEKILIDEFSFEETDEDDTQTIPGSWYRDLYGLHYTAEDGKKYLFDKNGTLVKNRWKYMSGKYYYFQDDGSMAIDKMINGWYLDKEGQWVPNKWELYYDGWRCIRGDGEFIKDGIKKVNGKYFCFDENGITKINKWYKDEKGWRYFRESGIMQTGWRKINNRYYNFGSDGVLCNGDYGQRYAKHIISIPGYYISPMLADHNNTRSERIEAMIKTGLGYLGTRYKPCRAGRPGTTCDCSGLVMQGLYAAGYDPHPVSPKRHAKPEYEFESRSLWNDKRIKKVPSSKRQRGDLVFYRNRYGRVVHIGIYLGNNRVLEEWPPKGMIRPLYWSQRPYVKGFKRVF